MYNNSVMKRPKFKYDTRLSEAELNLFEDLVGKSISSFRLENATVGLPPNFFIDNVGKCRISFYAPAQGPYATMELTSLFQETPPVGDSGGIAIRKIFESHIPLKTRMGLNLKQEWNPATLISYPEASEIKSFRFFGSKERRELDEMDPDGEMDPEWLRMCGFNELPEIEVDTLEFVLIEHVNNRKTIISTQSGGFWYTFLTDKPIDDQLLYDSYMKVNGYEKNIVLHHEIK